MIHPYSAILFRSKRKSIIKPGNTCYEVASVVSDPVRTQRRQPTRLCCPWDSPGKNTREGCHFLLQCMKVKSEREVAQSCPTLSNPIDCSLPGSSLMGFSRQEYWSGVPLPSPGYIYKRTENRILKRYLHTCVTSGITHNN